MEILIITILRSHNIARHKSCSLSLNILKRGKREKQKIVQISVLSLIVDRASLPCLRKVEKGELFTEVKKSD